MSSMFDSGWVIYEKFVPLAFGFFSSLLPTGFLSDTGPGLGAGVPAIVNVSLQAGQ